jgi:transcriptional regulator with XRE-family HTH domain
MNTASVKTYYDYAGVAALIDASGVPQVELAKEVGVTPVTITRVKSGTASPVLLAKIADKLGFDYRSYLLPAEEVAQVFSEDLTSDVDSD